MKRHVIKLAYHATVSVFNGPFNEFAKYMDRKGCDVYELGGSMGLCLEYVDDEGVKQWVLWSETGDLETLSHEAVHAAVLILKDRGIPLVTADNNSETLAYMVGDIVQKWEKTLRKDK